MFELGLLEKAVEDVEQMKSAYPKDMQVGITAVTFLKNLFILLIYFT